MALRTFIYPFSTNGTREKLLPSENFRVNKTTLTNTDPPFINCTDRAPNEATRLADSFRSSRRREERFTSDANIEETRVIGKRAPSNTSFAANFLESFLEQGRCCSRLIANKTRAINNFSSIKYDRCIHNIFIYLAISLHPLHFCCTLEKG